MKTPIKDRARMDGIWVAVCKIKDSKLNGELEGSPKSKTLKDNRGISFQ